MKSQKTIFIFFIFLLFNISLISAGLLYNNPNLPSISIVGDYNFGSCSASNYVYGINDDGTLLCRADVSGNGVPVWDATFNTTGDSRWGSGLGDNASWNRSYADTLYSTGSHTVIWDNTFNSSFDTRDKNTQLSEATVDGYADDNGYLTSYTEKDPNLWNASFNSTGDARWGGGSGDNASWNRSYADTLYSGIEWDYNQTTATYNLYNTVWLSTINKTSDNFNKTYADTLYSTGSHTVIWDNTFNTSFDARDKNTITTIWDATFNTSGDARWGGGSGDNVSWNRSYADTLYSGIEWDYNQTTATYNLYNTVWLSTINKTSDNFNKTYADTLYSTGSHTVIWDNTFNTSFDARDKDTDTNESTRFATLVATDCTGSDKVTGVDTSGALVCDTDLTGEGAVGNPFNQVLNLTSNVTFARINATDWSNISITESQISDLTHTVIWDATFNTSFANLDSDTITTIWDTDFNTSFDARDKDTQLSEVTVDGYCDDNGYSTGSHTVIWDATFNTSFDARDKDTITTIWDATFNTSFDARDTNTQLSEDNVEAFIFDNDNTANLNMSSYNVTGVDCIIFKSGGKICTA